MTPHGAIVNGRGFGETTRFTNGCPECGGRDSAQVQSRIDSPRSPKSTECRSVSRNNSQAACA